jgi:hypothetical protein
MADYNKSTNFTAKDTLPTGNAGKIVKGTEIDTELNAVSNAIASKADINSPSFTGTPTGPTASAGTATTQFATTAFVTAALQAVYPVGSIYVNASSASNPNTLLGFGTWTAFGTGRVLVGLDAGDTIFDTVEETGGSKDSAVIAHTHTYSGTTGNDSPDHTHLNNAVGQGPISPNINWVGTGGGQYRNTNDTQTAGASTRHQHSFSGTTASTGSSGTNANLPPYIVVRMWKRTA